MKVETELVCGKYSAAMASHAQFELALQHPQSQATGGGRGAGRGAHHSAGRGPGRGSVPGPTPIADAAGGIMPNNKAALRTEVHAFFSLSGHGATISKLQLGKTSALSLMGDSSSSLEEVNVVVRVPARTLALAQLSAWQAQRGLYYHSQSDSRRVRLEYGVPAFSSHYSGSLNTAYRLPAYVHVLHGSVPGSAAESVRAAVDDIVHDYLQSGTAADASLGLAAAGRNAAVLALNGMLTASEPSGRSSSGTQANSLEFRYASDRQRALAQAVGSMMVFSPERIISISFPAPDRRARSGLEDLRLVISAEKITELKGVPEPQLMQGLQTLAHRLRTGLRRMPRLLAKAGSSTANQPQPIHVYSAYGDNMRAVSSEHDLFAGMVWHSNTTGQDYALLGGRLSTGASSEFIFRRPDEQSSLQLQFADRYSLALVTHSLLIDEGFQPKPMQLLGPGTLSILTNNPPLVKLPQSWRTSADSYAVGGNLAAGKPPLQPADGDEKAANIAAVSAMLGVQPAKPDTIAPSPSPGRGPTTHVDAGWCSDDDSDTDPDEDMDAPPLPAAAADAAEVDAAAGGQPIQGPPAAAAAGAVVGGQPAQGMAAGAVAGTEAALAHQQHVTAAILAAARAEREAELQAQRQQQEQVLAAAEAARVQQQRMAALEQQRLELQARSRATYPAAGGQLAPILYPGISDPTALRARGEGPGLTRRLDLSPTFAAVRINPTFDSNSPKDPDTEMVNGRMAGRPDPEGTPGSRRPASRLRLTDPGDGADAAGRTGTNHSGASPSSSNAAHNGN
eukprot:XP_001694826.1 predicted protein [Chlamydomonas reinhardtii]